MRHGVLRFLSGFLHKKVKFSMKDFFSICKPKPQFPANLVTFTEEILYGKLHFLCSVLFRLTVSEACGSLA